MKGYLLQILLFVTNFKGILHFVSGEQVNFNKITPLKIVLKKSVICISETELRRHTQKLY